MKKEYYCVNDIVVDGELMAARCDKLFKSKDIYYNKENKNRCCKVGSECEKANIIMLD